MSFLAVGTMLILLSPDAGALDHRGQRRGAVITWSSSGAGPRGQELYNRILSEAGEEIRVIGFADSADFTGGLVTDRSCSLDELERVLMKEEVDEVLIALPVKSCYTEIQRVIQICERARHSREVLGPALRACSIAAAGRGLPERPIPRGSRRGRWSPAHR